MVVVDGSQPFAEADRRIVAESPAPRIVVSSKADLPHAWTAASAGLNGEHVVELSVKTGAGLHVLRERMIAALTDRETLRDVPSISNVRHLDLVDRAADSLQAAMYGIDAGATEELILTDLGAARRALEELTGRRTPEDLLRHIFERFCIGK